MVKVKFHPYSILSKQNESVAYCVLRGWKKMIPASYLAEQIEIRNQFW